MAAHITYTQRMENVLKPECLLATQMNDEPLPAVYGAPLRLRVDKRNRATRWSNGLSG